MENILIILSWNIDKNVEENMMQSRSEHSLPANQLVQGVQSNREGVKKNGMNYLVHQNYIFDLDNNVPFFYSCMDQFDN